MVKVVPLKIEDPFCGAPVGSSPFVDPNGVNLVGAGIGITFPGLCLKNSQTVEVVRDVFGDPVAAIISIDILGSVLDFPAPRFPSCECAQGSVSLVIKFLDFPVFLKGI